LNGWLLSPADRGSPAAGKTEGRASGPAFTSLRQSARCWTQAAAVGEWAGFASPSPNHVRVKARSLFTTPDADKHVDHMVCACSRKNWRAVVWRVVDHSAAYIQRVASRFQDKVKLLTVAYPLMSNLLSRGPEDSNEARDAPACMRTSLSMDRSCHHRARSRTFCCERHSTGAAQRDDAA
jgi:hypothetical protein